jgi:hypothetical protein
MPKKYPDKIIKEFGTEFRESIKKLLTAAFGFVAALSWNEAIKSFIQTVVPQQNQWPYLVLNALVITFVAVVVVFLVSRVGQPKKS